MNKRVLSKYKVALTITFVIMILLRIVWMQLRTYDFSLHVRTLATIDYLNEYSNLYCKVEGDEYKIYSSEGVDGPYHRVFKGWLLSKGLIPVFTKACKNEVLSTQKILNWNQWLVVSCTFLCVMIARMLSGSWVVGAGSGVVLLSRGDIIARIGYFSPDSLMMFHYSLWFSCLVFFFRSGSYWGVIGLSLVSILGGLSDEVFISAVASLTIVLAYWLFGKSKLKSHLYSKMKIEGPRGSFSLFYAYKVSFKEWFLDHKNNWKYVFYFFGITFVSLALVFLAYRLTFSPYELGFVRKLMVFDRDMLLKMFDSGLYIWLAEFVEVMDVHFVLSLVVIILALKKNSYQKLNSLSEVSTVFLVSFALLIVMSLVIHFVDYKAQDILFDVKNYSYFRFATRNVIVWVEPVMLTLGVVSLYQIILKSNRLKN